MTQKTETNRQKNMMKKYLKGRDKQTKENDEEGHKRQRQIDERT